MIEEIKVNILYNHFCHFSLLPTKLSHLLVLDNRDCVPPSRLAQIPHQLPLSGLGLKLQNVLIVDGSVIFVHLTA